MIVVDLGCARHGNEESVGRLIERFRPSVLFGFDPNAVEGISRIGETVVVLTAMAAWTRPGRVLWLSEDIRSRIDSPAVRGVSSRRPPAVGEANCFDFPNWLRALPSNGPIVLKVDVEGSEYVLLPALFAEGLDVYLARILVEWHDEPLDLPFRCPVEEWA